MKLSQPVKYSIFLGIIIASPFAYTYFMMYWSFMSMPVVEYFEPSTGAIAGILMITANTLGIAVVGVILSLLLTVLFSKHSFIPALVVVVAIVSWNLRFWVLHQEIPNYITMIEWFTVLTLIPVIVVLFNRRKTDEGESSCA